MPRKISTPESDDDILWGAEEIGAAIGRAAAQVYYLHSIGAISTKKVGHKLLIAVPCWQTKPSIGRALRDPEPNPAPGAPPERRFNETKAETAR